MSQKKLFSFTRTDKSDGQEATKKFSFAGVRAKFGATKAASKHQDPGSANVEAANIPKARGTLSHALVDDVEGTKVNCPQGELSFLTESEGRLSMQFKRFGSELIELAVDPGTRLRTAAPRAPSFGKPMWSCSAYTWTAAEGTAATAEDSASGAGRRKQFWFQPTNAASREVFLVNFTTALLPSLAETEQADACRQLLADTDNQKLIREGSTLLGITVHLDDVLACRGFLQLGLDVNEETVEGAVTPLLLAAQSDNATFAHLLLEAGARVDGPEAAAYSPLLVAVRTGRYELCQVLLKAGADRERRDAEKDATPLYLAVRQKEHEIMALLLESGANVNTFTSHGVSPLMLSTIENDLGVCQQLLQAGANVNAQVEEPRGPTALLGAGQAPRGETNDAIVKLLIDAGADVNASDSHGRTALFRFAVQCRASACSLLLKAGAKDIPFGPCNDYMALHAAVQEDSSDCVEVFIQAGANINEQIGEYRMTPTYIAAESGAKQALKTLLSAGADVHICTTLGASPLYIASEDGKLEECCALLEAGAQVQQRRFDGGTPFHVAIRLGHDHLALILLAEGAETHVHWSKGRLGTPLFTACGMGNTDMMLNILHDGANHLPAL